MLNSIVFVSALHNLGIFVTCLRLNNLLKYLRDIIYEPYWFSTPLSPARPWIIHSSVCQAPAEVRVCVGVNCESCFACFCSFITHLTHKSNMCKCFHSICALIHIKYFSSPLCIAHKEPGHPNASGTSEQCLRLVRACNWDSGAWKICRK